MDMTKFQDARDPGFIALAGELRRWSKKLPALSLSTTPQDPPSRTQYLAAPPSTINSQMASLNLWPKAEAPPLGLLQQQQQQPLALQGGASNMSLSSGTYRGMSISR
jgi:hypothetical protein